MNIPRNDYEVEEWVKEFLKDSHDLALNILGQAKDALQDEVRARGLLGPYAESYALIKTIVTALYNELSSKNYSFNPMTLADEESEHDTVASSQLGITHFNLRAPFYGQGPIARARTIIHELCHVLIAICRHDRDHEGWQHNAYRWTDVIDRLTGLVGE